MAFKTAFTSPEDPLGLRPRRLRILRKAKGLTQGELSLRSGIPQSAISSAERGFSSPGVLLAIAEAIGFTEDPIKLLDIEIVQRVPPPTR